MIPPQSRLSIRKRVVVVAAAIVASALALSGCAADEATTTNDATAASDAFPVTIESALGSATIDEAPTRVATWGWSSQDAVLALGIVPVAMPYNSYGGNDEGVLPWDAEAIADLGGETPMMLSGSDTGEVPVEEFIEADPDIILAPYSGITQEDYDTLSKIAPVVAYPDEPWSLPWQDQLTTIGEALGKSAEAAELQASVASEISDLAAGAPVLEGKTFVYVSALEADQLNIFRASDPRVDLLTQLGMVVSPNVADLDADPTAGSYFYQLSYENLGEIDADLIVGYFDSQASVDTFLADPLVAAMPAVEEGRFAPVVGESFVMASSAPTVLSIPWMLDSYVPELAAAADNVG
ncbi:iron complex transport system substrate-binding protein [Microbacterium halimionae]|uniref:Iron complex transport system substrate-binding protein n=1 Tax=Microbacterium halimionae TaxID=1526413 RepID=A0A7W3PME0_9MICO|nr:iron-siderophore ABC transporter substrate-binding protein [Microbacterium halimionae]MBA8816809.1 iron complex transport system substrate-binding protein [Microbacterium halimionae]NII94895.1 iron complex transport system substrate-binding protein [Microbacterium halimionae]